jgi:putative flavoprotein involved in K+ transport
LTIERIDTVVIGGGQAGLAVGYYLTRHHRDFVILEAAQAIGEAWRKRWDSLHLFTPANLNNLPGMAFPARGGHFPAKNEMADYLGAYAARFELPIQLGVKVDEVTRESDRYRIAAGARRLEANQVVVATGAYATPQVPAFASQLDPTIIQLHSVAYRNADQLRDGPVLVVGAGNSGAEIALDLAPKHGVWLSGRDPGHLSGAFGGFRYQVGSLIFQALMKRLTVDTWPGRWIVQKARDFQGGHPLIRIHPKDLLQAGVQRVPPVVEVRNGRPVLEDGRVLEAINIVWATGFVRDYRWIKLPVFDAEVARNPGDPIHHRGVVQTEPGLSFIGLPFLSSLLSSLVAGAGVDAKYIVRRIVKKSRSPNRVSQVGDISGDLPKPRRI